MVNIYIKTYGYGMHCRIFQLIQDYMLETSCLHFFEKEGIARISKNFNFQVFEIEGTSILPQQLREDRPL